MSEMVERVARAICQTHCDAYSTPDDKMVNMENLTVPYWTCWVKDARAAIAAMRDPDREMVYAAMTTPYPTVAEAGGVLLQAEEAARLEWQAMIDAALAESLSPDPGC